jgi:hypothetical protein
VRIRSVFTHSAQVIAEGALLSLLVVGLMAGTAFAAKGGGSGAGGGGGHKGGGGSGSGGGTVAMVLSTDVGNDGAVSWGDTITYTVSTTATVYPYVSTQCTQNGTLVLSDSAGWYASYAWPDARFLRLATDRWTGGAASCTARLYSMDGGSQTILNTISFSVGA